MGVKCEHCGRQIPSAGHVTMACPDRRPMAGDIPIKTSQIRVSRGPILDTKPDRGPIRKVKWSDLRELNIKKLQVLLPCEVLADGEVIARLEKP